jgi:hypothetical protein
MLSVAKLTHMFFIACICAVSLGALSDDAQAQDPELSGELWGEAEAFRLIGSSDFLGALSQSSTPEANLKFAELAKLVWPHRPGPEAWSGFLRYSLVNFIAGGYEKETVLYQHPWADVVLITSWARGPDGQLRIIDIGIAMGSVVRGATTPFPVGRGWLAEPAYAPEAVGQLNAATTRIAADFEAGVTEHPLAALTEDEIWAMISGVSLQLMEHQIDLLPLLVDEPGTARAMRFAWNEVMAAAQQGRLAEVLAPGAPVEALSAVDKALWSTLEPVAYFEIQTGAVAIFASWRNPDLFVAARVRGEEKNGFLSDLDLYSFSSFLKEGAK